MGFGKAQQTENDYTRIYREYSTQGFNIYVRIRFQHWILYYTWNLQVISISAGFYYNRFSFTYSTRDCARAYVYIRTKYGFPLNEFRVSRMVRFPCESTLLRECVPDSHSLVVRNSCGSEKSNPSSNVYLLHRKNSNKEVNIFHTQPCNSLHVKVIPFLPWQGTDFNV